MCWGREPDGHGNGFISRLWSDTPKITGSTPVRPKIVYVNFNKKGYNNEKVLDLYWNR